MTLSSCQFFVAIILQIIYSCGSQKDATILRTDDEVIDGVTMVAPPRPYTEDPATEIKKLGADWVAIIPYGFTPDDEPAVYFNQSRQWWGETKEGIIETIHHCRASGMKVMLKPQIWARHKWSGDIEYQNDQDWKAWENGYRKYITQMADIADSMQVEILCIGTELKKSVAQKPDFWAQLIEQIRDRYNGRLTYAANWDSYEAFPYWRRLDYIGVDAYFPLSDSRHPDRHDLILAWKPIAENMQKLSAKTNKSILFTEFGYLSTDYNTHNTWEKEKQIHKLDVNEEAQAVALDVLFECFYSKNWWAGGFIWKWYPPDYKIRNKSKDYTVQDKQAQQILRKWYNK